jgi:uncharacterized RDD family membrane protein YckC
MLARAAFTLPRLLGSSTLAVLAHQQSLKRTAHCDNRPPVLPPPTKAPVPVLPSWRRRVLAHVIDAGFMLVPLGACFGVLAYYAWRGALAWSASVLMPCALAVLAAPFLYDLVCLQRHAGTTPGKRWLGMRVVRASGDPSTPLSFAQIMVRRFVTSYVAVWNFVALCLDAEHRSLADRAAGTRVVFAASITSA